VRPVHLCLVLSAMAWSVPLLALSQGHAPAPGDTTYRVSGIIRDSARAPIPQAEVVALVGDSVRQVVMTSPDGRFSLGSFAAGPLALRVRRLGYQQRTAYVQVGAQGLPTEVDIVLLAVAAKLEEVAVAAPEGRLAEYFQRKEQRKAFGRFMEESEIRRLGPVNASDLFRSVPGIAIRTSAAGGNTIRVRNCQPTVWVDGQRIPGAELDEVAQPGDIAAIEFYPSSAGTPAQYMDRENRLCGSILVWLKVR
jgi:carboxypeptidase family protein/TonB-dependent receptor-like protein